MVFVIMGLRDIIESKLQVEFEASIIDVIDDSERHLGHAGYREGGESHFNVMLVSSKFVGVNRVKRSRLVHSVLKAELADSVHALSLKLYTSEEYSKKLVENT